MKIGIVAFPFDKGKSGQWNYIKEIIKNISKIDKNNKYYIFTHYKFDINNKNFKQILLKSKLINNPLINILWHQTFLYYYAKRYKLDLLHLLVGNRRLMFLKPCKIITSIMDLSQYNVKGKYNFLRMFYVKRVLPLLTKKIDSIICISDSTKKDVIKYWKLKNIPTRVIPIGLKYKKNLYFRKKISIQKKYHLVKDYIFYVSRLEHPGKNHMRLIKAYEKLRKEKNIKQKLVFAGSDWNGADKIYQAAKKSEFSKDIIFLGFVPDSDLPYLYKNASLFVFPSLYEGFGIPILEAMAYKTPVICSNTSSMPEVLGDCGLTFDPFNVDDINNKMKNILFDNNLKDKFIKRGFERVRLFNWKKIAKKTIALYNNIK